MSYTEDDSAAGVSMYILCILFHAHYPHEISSYCELYWEKTEKFGSFFERRFLTGFNLQWFAIAEKVEGSGYCSTG